MQLNIYLLLFFFFQDKLNTLLAKAIFASGAPISMVSHPLWIELFNLIRPSYKLPARKTIANKLLDEEYTKMKSLLVESLSDAKNLNLQMDGWSNCRNDSIINFIITQPDPIFVEFIDTKANRHTAEYLANEVIKVIENFDAEKFLVLIGDHAANVQKALKKVQEKYPHLIVLGLFFYIVYFNSLCLLF